MGLVTTLSSPGSALTGSSFEEGDGNLTVQGSGTAKDWANVNINCTSTPKIGCSLDKISGTGDNAFGNGTAENDPVPSIVTDGIPPNKSDLTRFYVATTKENGNDYLHLAWERVQDPSGTTNMDFEFNQSTTLSSNGVTPVRTAGDLLIKFDLSNGGTVPSFGLHTWVTTGNAQAVCEAGSKLPCWSKFTPLNSTTANGSVNGGPVTDPIGPDAPRTLSARTFGEATINLTTSNLFPSTSCVNFGSAYLKSRSSDSFTAAIKDFASPVGVSVSNCGTINVHKQDDAGAALAGAVFTLYNDASPTGGSRGAGDTAVVPAKTCQTDASGNCSFTNVTFGNYWVVETTTPAGHTTAADQAVALTAQASPVALTFVNPRQPASVTLHKQDDTGAPLAGASFALYTNNAPTATRGNEDSITNFTCTSQANGNCVISNILPVGDFWIVETGVPAGYTGAADRAVTLSLGQTLDITTPFVDPRQPASIKLHKQDDAGAALGGATFTLYTNVDPKAAPHGAGDMATSFSCVTNSSGDCTISNILPVGDFFIVETGVPAGYTGAADRAVTLSLGQNLDITGSPFVNVRKPAKILLHKQDDAGAPLGGATFTLFVNNGTKAAPRGPEDTQTGFACTTDSNGNCTIDNILPAGDYLIAETVVPPGYVGAADRAVTLALDQTLDLTGTPFVNARKFTIIVLVCQESNGTLHPSTVTVDGVDKTSLDSSSIPDGVCSTGGASYTGKAAGNHPANVNIP